MFIQFVIGFARIFTGGFTVLLPYQNPQEEYAAYHSMLALLFREYLLWQEEPALSTNPGEWELPSLLKRLEQGDRQALRLFTLSEGAQNEYQTQKAEAQQRAKEATCFLPLDYLCDSLQIPWEGRLLVMCSYLAIQNVDFTSIMRYCNRPSSLPFLNSTVVLELFFRGSEANLRQAKESYLPVVFLEEKDPARMEQTFFQLKPRIMDLLLEGSILKNLPWAESYHVFETLPPLYGREKEEKFLVSALTGDIPLNILLSGETGSGRLFLLRHACQKARKNLLVVSWKRLLEQPWPQVLQTLAGELRLQRAVCCLTDFPQSPDVSRLKELEAALRPIHPVLLFRLEPEVTLPEVASQHRFWLRELDFEGNRALWESSQYPLEKEVDAAELAGKYRFLPGQIIHILTTCREQCRLNNRESISLSQIEAACLERTGDGMGDAASRLNTGYTMEDLILPPEEKQQIQEGMDHLRFRYRVYDQWNFKQKLKYGQGLSMLFEGPPGTGKTMAASIIGNELGLPVFQIDLSRVLSKYIGETEKSLGKIFDLAGKNNAILFFDETDALFGKRSEIKDSHDKYANVETSFLLQKMEEYQGVVIMTTNLLTNIDSAFLRRISYIIHFPFPDSQQRKALWQSVFPAEAPRDTTVDIAFLAERFEMTGAMIKNSAVSAAFLAAAQDRKITMKDILYAIQKQFSKHGKRISMQELGPYSAYFKESTWR